ncbi:serine hydrolase [Massilia sp. PAMC28688]|uniref:serine hydrolase domain-containing protein n=1 Tax=Massilia sp. PAMC28688 TaxID=2861283 RepID=UPI001C636E4A|nr:serine hydrolase domain-containing protein [Massilia sp. PAMC28688]QYF95389.1 serine hydrolase [Massilia sp. PAMC28688]
MLADRPLLTAPNAAYHYSSWGYTLLRAVIEADAGKSFLDYIGDEVTPGLAISADASDHGDTKASEAYEFADGRAVRLTTHDMSYTWGGGGLAAPREAIALFGSRVMNGKVVSPKTFKAMLELARLADGSVVREREYEVGFGWRTSRGVNSDMIAHHAGVTGGARSALVLWPSSRISASGLSNAQRTSSIETTVEMLAAPFQQKNFTGDQPTARCPVDALAYKGEFDGERFRFGRNMPFVFLSVWAGLMFAFAM